MTHFTESKEEYVGGQSYSGFFFFLRGTIGHILPTHMNSHNKKEFLRHLEEKVLKVEYQTLNLLLQKNNTQSADVSGKLPPHNHLTSSVHIYLTFKKHRRFAPEDLKERTLIVKCNKVLINGSDPLIVPLMSGFVTRKLQNILKLFTRFASRPLLCHPVSLHTHFYTKNLPECITAAEESRYFYKTQLTLTHFHVMVCIYCFRPWSWAYTQNIYPIRD